MNSRARITPVHFVGSIPLANSEEVFRAVARSCGDVTPRIPDGETGDRSQWIQFQRAAMDQAVNLKKVKEYQFAPGIVQSVYAVAEAARPVVFGDLRYAREAIQSYQKFAALKKAGVIDPATRFQVALPTPLAVTAGFIDSSSQQTVEVAYQERLLQELREILNAVPHRDLAIQWDVAYEVILLEGWTGGWYFDRSRAGLFRRLSALGEEVPENVSLGYHLCYGDPGHKHLVEPESLRLCVEIANALTAGAKRAIDWIHMPVPRDKGVAEYFRPLRDLALGDSTQLFLGLIHFTDGFLGTMQRVRVATEFFKGFGVATECGFGRREPKTVTPLLELHRQVATAEI